MCRANIYGRSLSQLDYPLLSFLQVDVQRVMEELESVFWEGFVGYFPLSSLLLLTTLAHVYRKYNPRHSKQLLQLTKGARSSYCWHSNAEARLELLESVHSMDLGTEPYDGHKKLHFQSSEQ
jgi:hypothetical protein